MQLHTRELGRKPEFGSGLRLEIPNELSLQWEIRGEDGLSNELHLRSIFQSCHSTRDQPRQRRAELHSSKLKFQSLVAHLHP